MASESEWIKGKRRHVETKRMREFKAVEEESKDRKKQCTYPECNKMFTSVPGLRYHINTHSPIKSSFSCEDCCRSFKSLNGLKYHNSNKSTCRSKLNVEKEKSGCKKQKRSPSSSLDVKLQRTKYRPSFDDDNRLRDLAIIATGPQSPLLQKTTFHYKLEPECKNVKRALDLTCKAKSATQTSCKEESSWPDTKVCLPLSPTTDSTGERLSHSWPTVVWHCFLKGTQFHFSTTDVNSNTKWITAEELAQQDQNNFQSHKSSPLGFKVQNIQICSPMVILTFQLTDNQQTSITAHCHLSHPFFVQDKGCCSCNPKLTAEHYGITCQYLTVNDLCLPPSHHDATLSTVYNQTNFLLSPLDSSAVIALSSMAQKKNQEHSPSASKLRESLKSKVKRPMNGFLLFAQKNRLDYKQKYPGKDNRAISKLLGEQWKILDCRSKEVYKEEAKQISNKLIKLHPNCWKRKR